MTSVMTKANINLILSVVALLISTVLGINVLIEVRDVPPEPTDLNFSGDTDTK